MQTKAFFNSISMLTTDIIGGADQRNNPYNILIKNPNVIHNSCQIFRYIEDLN